MAGRDRRDWLTLPLLAIAAAATCVLAAEGLARLAAPEQLDEVCLARDAVGAQAFRPGCESRLKAAEGPWTSVRYNACGYRSAGGCKVPGKDEYRIAVLGSSISRGYAVTYEQSFAPRLEGALGRACARPVNVQSINLEWPTGPARSAGDPAKADEVAALRPDLILVFVSSWDLYKYTAPSSSTEQPASGLRSTEAFKTLSRAMGILRGLREQSRFVLLARHFLYRDEIRFIDDYLSKSDEAGYLRTPLTPAWEARLDMLESALSPLDAVARRNGVPLELVFVPFEPQVLLAKTHNGRAGVDPNLLPSRLADIAQRRGWRMVDVTPALQMLPAGRSAYYRVNGHPNAAGHEAIARGIEDGVGSICRSRAQ